MEKFKYFLECYFHFNEGFDNLDNIIQAFKKEPSDSQLQFVKELHQIICANNYTHADKFLRKYGGLCLDDTEEVKVFIKFLYDRLTDNPTKVKPEDFIKKCKIVFCPVCCPDPETSEELNVIEKATIIENNKQIYICKPCKLVWLDEENIKADNAQNYKKYMQSVGLKGLWKELTDIDIL